MKPKRRALTDPLWLRTIIPLFGEIVEEEEFIALLAVADVFKHVHSLDRFWENLKCLLDQSPLCQPLVRAMPPLLGREQLRAETERVKGLLLYRGTDPKPVVLMQHGN